MEVGSRRCFWGTLLSGTSEEHYIMWTIRYKYQSNTHVQQYDMRGVV